MCPCKNTNWWFKFGALRTQGQPRVIYKTVIDGMPLQSKSKQK